MQTKYLPIIIILLLGMSASAQDKPRGGNTDPSDFTSTKEKDPNFPFSMMILTIYEKDEWHYKFEIDDSGCMDASKYRTTVDGETATKRTEGLHVQTRATLVDLAITAYLCSASECRTLSDGLTPITTQSGTLFHLTIHGDYLDQGSKKMWRRVFDAGLNDPVGKKLKPLIDHLIRMRDSILK